MANKIKATMFAKPGVMLTPLNCPLCGDCDQHKQDCILSGKEHIYVSGSQGLTDWPKALELNNIEIVDGESAKRKEAIAGALWSYFLGDETSPGVYDHDDVRARIDGDIHIDELAEWIAKRL